MALGNGDHKRPLPELTAAGAETGTDIIGPQGELRCTQCGTNKTPQWRTGPQGPRTMCNACGVKWQRAERRAQAPANEEPAIPASSRGSRRQACRAAARRHRFVSVYYSGSEEEIECDDRVHNGKRRLSGQAAGQPSIKNMRSHKEVSYGWAGTTHDGGQGELSTVDADEEAAALDLLALAGSSDGSPVREISAYEAVDAAYPQAPAISISQPQLPFPVPAAAPMTSLPQIIQPTKTSGPSALKASAIQALVAQLECRGIGNGVEVSEGGETCATVGPLVMKQDAAATASLAGQRSYTSGSQPPAGQQRHRLRTQPLNVYNSNSNNDPDSDSGEVADHHESQPQVPPTMTTTSARPAQRRRTCGPAPPPLLPASSSYLARNAGNTVAAMLQAAQQQQVLPPLSRYNSLEECCSGSQGRQAVAPVKHEAADAAQTQLASSGIKPELAAERSGAGATTRSPALSAPTRAQSLTLTAGALPPIQLPPVSLSATTWQPAQIHDLKPGQSQHQGSLSGHEEGISPPQHHTSPSPAEPPAPGQVTHLMRLSGAVMAAMQGLQQAEAARSATAALVSSRAAVANAATQAALAKTAALAAELQALETMLALQAGASPLVTGAGIPNAGLAATVLAASAAAQEAVLAANLAYTQSLIQRSAASGVVVPAPGEASLPRESPATKQEAEPIPSAVAH